MLFTRTGILLAKIETTVGTDAAPTGTDGACNFFNVNVQPNVAMVQRQGQGSFNKLASVPEGHGVTITFSTYIEWDGTATEPFWADVLLPACGWVKNTNTFTPRTEAPGSNVKTLTFYHYLGQPGSSQSKLRRIYGAAGTGIVNLPTGKPAYIDWTFQGVWGGEVAGTMPTPTYPTAKPLRFAGGLAEFGDVNLCVSNATVDLGNTLYLRECPTTTAGYISALVTDRTPLVTLDPEAKLIATRDVYADWIANQTERFLELDIAGPNGSALSFDAPKAQIINNTEGDRSGLAIDTLQLQCNKNGTSHDQELSIVFTPSA